jgi:hypothetical protein
MNIFMALLLSKEALRPGDTVDNDMAADDSDEIRDRDVVMSLGDDVLSRWERLGLSLLRESDLLRRGLGRTERPSICSYTEIRGQDGSDHELDYKPR